MARSWHRLSTEIYWPVCWAQLQGPGLCPDSMMGEGSSCTDRGLPGPTDGQPQEDPTGQGGAAVKRSSLGFISKMLPGWQEHTCPQQERPPEAPRALERLWVGGLILELDNLSQTSAAPSLLEGPQGKAGGYVGTLNLKLRSPASHLPRDQDQDQDKSKARSLHGQPAALSRDSANRPS